MTIINDLSTPSGTLTIDSTFMHTRRWHIGDLSQLWTDIILNGETVHMPLANGDRTFPEYMGPTRYLLPLMVAGDVDEDGNCIDDPDEWPAQLRKTLGDLTAAIVGPPDYTGDGTRTAVHVTPDGETWTQGILVRPLVRRSGDDGAWLGDLEIVLPQPWVVT